MPMPPMDRFFDSPKKTPLADMIPGASDKATVISVDQGSANWFAARLGIPTASRIGDIVTTRGEPCKGTGRTTLMHTLVCERLTRVPEMGHSTAAMERGSELEPKARRWYEFESGADVQQVGFIKHADGYGASPDGLMIEVGTGKGLEIKCPMHRGMIAAILSERPPSGYIGQIQFSMWVTGLQSWDLLVYTPEAEIPNRIWTIGADEKLHKAYAELVPAFCAELDALEKHLRDMANK